MALVTRSQDALVLKKSPEPDLSRVVDVRNLEDLLRLAEQQQERQRRKFIQLTKQVEQELAMQASFDAKMAAREDKLAQLDWEKQVDRANRAARAAEAAALRQSRLEVAEDLAEAKRQAAMQKWDAHDAKTREHTRQRTLQQKKDKKTAEQEAARRQSIYEANLEIQEARRQRLLRKEQTVNELLRHREELREIQEQITAEENYLKEQERQATKARGEAELAAKVAFYEEKGRQKDEALERKKQELEKIRQMQSVEHRQREEYLRMQAEQQAQRNEQERLALEGRVSERMSRADTLEGQRKKLLKDMQHLRQSMQLQEVVLRDSLTKLRQSGTFALPTDVAKSIECFSPRASLVGLVRQSQMRKSMMALPASPHTPLLTGSRRPMSASVTQSVRKSNLKLLTDGKVRASHNSPIPSPSGGMHIKKKARPQSATDRAPESGSSKYNTVNYTPIPGASKEEELRAVLQQEIAKEAERQAMLSKVGDEREHSRLSTVFAAEREEAKQRILTLSSALATTQHH